MGILSEKQEAMRNRHLGISKPTVPQEELCTNCKRRKARRGSALCSRCTMTSVVSSLRDTLPGMEPEPQPQPDPLAEHEADCEMRESGVECTCKAAIEEFDEEQKQEEKRAAYYEQEGTNLQGPLYTRAQVCEIVGIGKTTLARWEDRGIVGLPAKRANGKLVYTEALLSEIKRHASQLTVREPRDPKSPQQQAAKGLTRKPFSLNKSIERAVSSKLGRLAFKPGRL